MATLDEDDIKQIEEIINNFVKKLEKQKSGKTKKVGLALFSAGLPLLAAGALLFFLSDIGTDWALIIGGSVIALIGYFLWVLAK